MTRIVVLCAGLLGLTACGGEVGLALLAANTAIFIHGDKTVVDHAVSYSTERDCSILYAVNDRNYCQPLEPIEPGQVAYLSSVLYCYRTLGGVSCYGRPDHAASSQTRIMFGDTLIPPLQSGRLAALPNPAAR